MIAELLSWTERAGGAGLAWILAANLWAGAVCLVAVGIDTLLARRVGARWRMLLYAAVVVRLAMPVDWQSPLGLVPSPAAPPALQEAGAPIVTFGPSETPASAAPAAAAAVELTWRTFLVLAYAAGAAFLLWRWGRSARRARLQAVHSRVHADPRVRVHDSAGPALVGLWRPVAVVPAWLAQPQHQRELAHVLRHEWAHLRAGDPQLAFLAHGLVIALWPVAAVWVAASRVRSLMELAADEAALRGEGEEGRVAYGRTLIHVAENFQGDRFMNASLGFGNSVRSRILAVSNRRRWPLALQVVGVCGMAAALVACAARGTSTAADPAPGRVAGDPLAAPAAGQVGQEGGPQVMWMCNIWRVPADFNLENALAGIGQSKGGIGNLQGDDMARAFFRRLDETPGVEFVSVPTVLSNAGQQASISIGDNDKAHSPVRDVSITLNGTPDDHGGISYSFTVSQDQISITRITAGPAQGHATIVVSTEAKNGWRSMVMIRPSLIRNPGEMPRQRSNEPRAERSDPVMPPPPAALPRRGKSQTAGVPQPPVPARPDGDPIVSQWWFRRPELRVDAPVRLEAAKRDRTVSAWWQRNAEAEKAAPNDPIRPEER